MYFGGARLFVLHVVRHRRRRINFKGGGSQPSKPGCEIPKHFNAFKRGDHGQFVVGPFRGFKIRLVPRGHRRAGFWRSPVVCGRFCSLGVRGFLAGVKIKRTCLFEHCRVRVFSCKIPPPLFRRRGNWEGDFSDSGFEKPRG